MEGSSVTATLASGSTLAHGTCSLEPGASSGERTVHPIAPLKTSNVTPTMRLRGASHSARWSVPRTVSVILPCTKRSGTGRNCALSESDGVESRLK